MRCMHIQGKITSHSGQYLMSSKTINSEEPTGSVCAKVEEMRFTLSCRIGHICITVYVCVSWKLKTSNLVVLLLSRRKVERGMLKRELRALTVSVMLYVYVISLDIILVGVYYTIFYTVYMYYMYFYILENVGPLCFTNGKTELILGTYKRRNPDMERILLNLLLIQPATHCQPSCITVGFPKRSWIMEEKEPQGPPSRMPTHKKRDVKVMPAKARGTDGLLKQK